MNLANIGAATLAELAPALETRLQPDGWVGLSGLSPAQLLVVGAAYDGLRAVATPQDDDWSAIVACHRGDPKPGSGGREKH